MQVQNGSTPIPAPINDNVTIHSEPKNETLLIPIKKDYVNRLKYQLILLDRNYSIPTNKVRIQIGAQVYTTMNIYKSYLRYYPRASKSWAKKVVGQHTGGATSIKFI